MDSMKSLNSSLPSSRPSRAAPPEDLLQAFRTAALSVTNLYKSAATSQSNARQAGYQDALEDLLRFLDQESLGLQDGEGWRVRQWATARYDGSPPRPDEEDIEEEPEETESRSRDVSHEREEINTTQQQSEEETTTQVQIPEETSESLIPAPIFHFSSTSHTDNNMQTDQPSTPQSISDASSSTAAAPIRVEVLNRNNRPTSRSHNSRHNARSNPREFTFSTGTKRKLQFPDFFDISNLNDKQDGSGGGGGGSKRGRFA